MFSYNVTLQYHTVPKILMNSVILYPTLTLLAHTVILRRPCPLPMSQTLNVVLEVFGISSHLLQFLS